MAAEIMDLANELVYGQRLRCGGGRVAEQLLDVPRFKTLEGVVPPGEEWILEAVRPQRRVVFIDTDGVRVAGW